MCEDPREERSGRKKASLPAYPRQGEDAFSIRNMTMGMDVYPGSRDRRYAAGNVPT